MPDATITSTASTFGTISGTFSSDQSTVTGTISGVVTGTLTGSVGVPGPAGPGVPTGGTTGQVLAKVDGVDYNTEWVNASGGVWGTITGTLSNQTDLQTALNLKAPLASPALTGVPTAPTAATLTSTTQLATTAFVQQELAAGTAVAKNLEVYVRNQSGSTIPAGSIVYISGATGNRPLITLAQANNDANSAQTIGFVKTSIANNGFGYVIVRGELENIDTSALTEGVQLYLSPTTAGAWTTTKPSAPEHLVYVGIVIRSHPTLGVILVAVQNGYELNELHDVAISSPTNGQVLKYDSATSLWKNSLDIGIPAGGTAGQFLTKIDGTDYNTDWTTVNLSVYAVKSNNLSDLTSASTARSNLSLGTLDTPVFAGVTAQGSGSNVAYLTPTSLSLTHATSGTFTIQPSSGITFPDSTVQTTAFTTAQLTNYLAKASNLSDLASASTARTNLGLGSLAVVNDAPSDGSQYARKNGAWDVVSIPSAYITSVSSPLSVTAGNLTIDLSAYLTSATAASTYQTQAGMSSYLTTSTAASTYLTQSNAASTYQTISGMSSYLTTSAAASTYAALSGATDLGTYTWSAPMSSNSVQVNSTSISLNGSSSITLGSTGIITFGDTTQQTTAYPGSSGFLLKADNLSGLASTSTARSNLGLGTMATETASNYLTTASASSTYAPLASPALTGTPTAPTATTGTNTTQVATTALVQQEVPAASTTVAGKVELATFVEATRFSSDTLAPNTKSLLGVITSSSGQIRPRSSAFTTATSGAGASASNYYAATIIYGPSASVNGYSGVYYDAAGSWASNNAYTTPDWSKVTGFSVMAYRPSIGFGNGNTIRITLGKAASGGTLSTRGIGIDIAAANTYVKILAHNGTTLTTTDSTMLVTAYANLSTRNITVVSYANGTVEFFMNGVSYGTSSGGPTTAGGTGTRYSEEVYGDGTQTGAMQLWTFGASIFTGL